MLGPLVVVLAIGCADRVDLDGAGLALTADEIADANADIQANKDAMCDAFDCTTAVDDKGLVEPTDDGQCVQRWFEHTWLECDPAGGVVTSHFTYHQYVPLSPTPNADGHCECAVISWTGSFETELPDGEACPE